MGRPTNASIQIENVGSSTIEGWELSYADGPEISSLWNADWQIDGDRMILRNLDWNSTLAPGAVAEIGFGGVGTFVENVNDALFNGVPITVQYGSDDDQGGDSGGESGDGDAPQPDLSGDGAVDGADCHTLRAAHIHPYKGTDSRPDRPPLQCRHSLLLERL